MSTQDAFVFTPAEVAGLIRIVSQNDPDSVNLPGKALVLKCQHFQEKMLPDTEMWVPELRIARKGLRP